MFSKPSEEAAPPPPPLQDNFPKRRAAPLKENFGTNKKFIGCCPTIASPVRIITCFFKKTGRAIGISCESSPSRGKRAVGNRRGTNKKGGGEKRITPATAGDTKTEKRKARSGRRQFCFSLLAVVETVKP